MGHVTRLGASYTVPALSRAEQDDMNAAIIENFDPVRLSLPEIEAMQRMLSEAAARHRAEMEGPADANPGPDFIQLSPGKDWAEYGELEGVFAEEDDLEPFLPEGAEDTTGYLDEGRVRVPHSAWSRVAVGADP